MNDQVFHLIQAFGSLATTVGVFLAWRSLLRAARQARTDFEDGFSREYRNLSEKLPVKALLGEALDPRESEDARPAFFRYVDLCNEQVFLRQNKRISKATWSSWCSGIKSNLELPAFSLAWKYIKQRSPQSFAELRKLEESDFKDDPVSWGRAHLEETQERPKPTPTSGPEAAEAHIAQPVAASHEQRGGCPPSAGTVSKCCVASDKKSPSRLAIK